jgi:transposase
LKETDLSYQKPEKKYSETDEALRQDWLTNELPRILETVKKYKAILYFEDESNISLTALLGKTWAPRGKTPTQQVTGARGGVSAISAISKQGSLIFNLHEKRIASQEIIHFLDQILKHHKRRHIVVVMDQAPPHTSKKTRKFIDSQKRLHVFYLPPYSPDWNPDEYVWNHLKHQELKGHQAKTKEEIKLLTQNKLTKMADDSHLMRGIFFRCYVADFLQ